MLEAWHDFYVIIGSSAAALTGLMFVVIALIPEAHVPRDSAALHAFATPTVVHFSTVVLLSALITMPRRAMWSLEICVAVAGAAGIVYAFFVTRRAKRQQTYSPELEDWIFHSLLPVIAYLSLFVSSLFLVRAPADALLAVAGSSLLLLFIGIHNAWDNAVWMTTGGEAKMQSDEQRIRELTERWLRATKAGDLETVLGLMTDDVVFLTAGQPPMSREKFADGFRAFAGKVPFEAKQDIKEIHVDNDLAYCWSTMTITIDGKKRAGNILSVFRKSGERWQLSRDANLVTESA